MGMLSAGQMKKLKERVKAEMARRASCGSLAEYAGESYDFTEAPEAGKPITAEQGRKTIDLLLEIKDYGDLVLVKEGEAIPDSLDTPLLTYMDTLAAEEMTGEASSCRGACTGLCLAGCGNTCSGCSGSCGGCGGCSSSCGTGCAGGARR